MRLKSIAIPLLLGLTSLGLAIFSPPPPVAAQASDIAVIVNPGNPVTNVSLGDLRKIFSGPADSPSSSSVAARDAPNGSFC